LRRSFRRLKEANIVNPIVNLGLLASTGLPADAVVADIPLWTATTRVALAFEILWIVSALGLLLWLTKPAKTNRSRPETPLGKRGKFRDDGVPPMAA
jgi:hypothetical protein